MEAVDLGPPRVMVDPKKRAEEERRIEEAILQEEREDEEREQRREMREFVEHGLDEMSEGKDLELFIEEVEHYAARVRAACGG